MEGSKINNRYRFGVVVYLHCLPAVAARAPQAHLHLHTWLVFERNYRRFYHSIRSQERASISDGSWRWLANSTDWLLMMLDTNGLDTRMISMLMILQFIAVLACLLRRLRNISSKGFINHVSHVWGHDGRKRRLFLLFNLCLRSAPYEGKATEHGNLSREDWEFKQIMTFWWSQANKWFFDNNAIFLPFERLEAENR